VFHTPRSALRCDAALTWVSSTELLSQTVPFVRLTNTDSTAVHSVDDRAEIFQRHRAGRNAESGRGRGPRREAAASRADSDRERAALGWTEAVTLVSTTHVPDSVYEVVRAQFSEEEIKTLTLAGDYKPAMFRELREAQARAT
jgi:alkylhydroperoxidase family enzyme